ncbi:hypothetical protein [Pseudoduganella sp. R-34]|uniref:hypothetical protein n=1 Tax=Pseudoduganella sp. R-34 TaxID=3404062 RepID=UPI003CF81819
MTDNPYSQPSAAVQAEHDLLPSKPVAVSMYRFFAWIAVLVALLGFFQLFDPVRLESGKSIAEGIAPRVVLLLAMGGRLFADTAVIACASLSQSYSLLRLASLRACYASHSASQARATARRFGSRLRWSFSLSLFTGFTPSVSR